MSNVALRSRSLQPLLYRHVRHAYQAISNREYLADRKALAALLAEFVHRGNLVFDVGANRGEYTDVLLVLGARVVSVEPNPTLAAELRRHYPVVVEEAAAARQPGVVELHLGNDPGHSTVAPRWLERAPTADRWSGGRVSVSTVTLDDLIRRHGSPDFVKIDVEGFEAEVLRGCSTTLPALSFEYQCADLEVTEECLGILGGYEFNFVLAQRNRFDGGWSTGAEMRRRLKGLCASRPDAYGDVYARRL